MVATRKLAFESISAKKVQLYKALQVFQVNKYSKSVTYFAAPLPRCQNFIITEQERAFEFTGATADPPSLAGRGRNYAGSYCYGSIPVHHGRVL